VSGVELVRVKLPQVPEVPSLVLKNVKDFSITQSKPVADTQVESTEQKKL
jgi:hypothetical protein